MSFFFLLQAQPPPTGRCCIALLILAGVTLILVLTGIFSYRHLSGLRVSAPTVLDNNGHTVGNRSEGATLTQLCFSALPRAAGSRRQPLPLPGRLRGFVQPSEATATRA